jgi:hypothetical protein
MPSRGRLDRRDCFRAEGAGPRTTDLFGKNIPYVDVKWFCGEKKEKAFTKLFSMFNGNYY